MGVERIPEKYINTCDICKTEETSLVNNRPRCWSSMKLEKTVYTPMGEACAEDIKNLLLCKKCTGNIGQLIDDLSGTEEIPF